MAIVTVPTLPTLIFPYFFIFLPFSTRDPIHSPFPFPLMHCLRKPGLFTYAYAYTSCPSLSYSRTCLCTITYHSDSALTYLSFLLTDYFLLCLRVPSPVKHIYFWYPHLPFTLYWYGCQRHFNYITQFISMPTRLFRIYLFSWLSPTFNSPCQTRVKTRLSFIDLLITLKLCSRYQNHPLDTTFVV